MSSIDKHLESIKTSLSIRLTIGSGDFPASIQSTARIPRSSTNLPEGRTALLTTRKDKVLNFAHPRPKLYEACVSEAQSNHRFE